MCCRRIYFRTSASRNRMDKTGAINAHSTDQRFVGIGYLSIGAIQPFDIETTRQKLMRCLQHDAFISLKHPDSMMPF